MSAPGTDTDANADTDPVIARVLAALAELRRLHAAEPAAARANAAVRLTAHTLDVLWLPLLDGDHAAR